MQCPPASPCAQRTATASGSRIRRRRTHHTLGSLTKASCCHLGSWLASGVPEARRNHSEWPSLALPALEPSALPRGPAIGPGQQASLNSQGEVSLKLRSPQAYRCRLSALAGGRGRRHQQPRTGRGMGSLLCCGATSHMDSQAHVSGESYAKVPHGRTRHCMPREAPTPEMLRAAETRVSRGPATAPPPRMMRRHAQSCFLSRPRSTRPGSAGHGR